MPQYGIDDHGNRIEVFSILALMSQSAFGWDGFHNDLFVFPLFPKRCGIKNYICQDI